MPIDKPQHFQHVIRSLVRRRWVLWLLLTSGCGLHTALGGAGGVAGGVAGTGGGTGSGSNWTNRTAGTAAAGLAWMDVASDSTGIHLVAVTSLGGVNPDGNIWTSADAGATWTNRTKGTQASGKDWASVASDSTGTHLVAVTSATGVRTDGQEIWISADEGATWTKRITVTSTTAAVVGPAVASDATGSHPAALEDTQGRGRTTTASEAAIKQLGIDQPTGKGKRRILCAELQAICSHFHWAVSS